jgi:Mor family transcriptional regulator
MSYIKATDILPKEILDLIQNYVDGEYIYIPRKECNRKEWGETTVIKNETSVRNIEIYEKYKAGVSVMVLSEEYYLSLKSIQRIILKLKRENQ